MEEKGGRRESKEEKGGKRERERRREGRREAERGPPHGKMKFRVPRREFYNRAKVAEKLPELSKKGATE
jgi:hypothetical protein